MSSDEADKKNVEEKTQETASSAEENEEKDEAKQEKVNSKPTKKKGADPPKIKQPAKKRVKTEQAEKESKKEEKKEDKKKVEKEEDTGEEEESAEENDVENHKAVPLLDQPLQISGSRKRKEVQRFKPTEPEEESKEVKIPKGKGKALGDIERVDFNIQRAKPEDLKLLHRLCLGKAGKAATVKKMVRKFNGFEFEEASDEYEKKKAQVEKTFKKVTIANLKNICNILDIEKSGVKDDIMDRILSFLTCPVDSGKKKPGEGRSKRSGASAKNYDEGEESFKDSKKKGKGKKKEKESEESDNEKDDEESEKEEEVKENSKKKDEAQTTEESEPEDVDEKEDEEEKPKKGAKKGKKAVEAADKKAPPKKRAAAKKAAEKKSDTEGDGDDESEDEDEEPLVKKAKTPPTDEEIKTYVKTLLEGANLELITMKKVCQDVYAHYPDFDLGHKKDFIKTTVKSLISS